MAPDRRYVLAGIAVAVAVIAAYLLREVLATVFFAITVAYVLGPVYNWWTRRGLSPWFASAATTVTAFAGVVIAFSPLFVVLYVRLNQLVSLVESIPERLVVEAFGSRYVLDASDVIPMVVDYVQNLAVSLAGFAPLLAVKLALFALVVFALLIGRQRLHDALVAVIPPKYHDVAEAFGRRAKSTLFAIYVLQAATAVATFAVALPVFVVLGYQYPFALATIAGVLQFLPIIGPSALVLAVAAYQAMVGDVVAAVTVTVVGLVLIAWFPDAVVRTRLARRTADLPGSLYFIGFTGGLFTLGVVGFIAGPLVVALLVEAVEQLADEMEAHNNHALDVSLSDEAGADGAAAPPDDGDPGSAASSAPGSAAGSAPDSAADSALDSSAPDGSASDSGASDGSASGSPGDPT